VAWDRNRMNQWFLLEEKGKKQYTFDKVQSIQLEFRWTGCRDKESLESTAKNVANAIKKFSPNSVIDINDPLVEKAYVKLANIFSEKYEQALMEAGQYIVRTFYGGEENIEQEDYNEEFEFDTKVIENARKNESPLGDSLLQLYKKISNEKTSNTPSRSWIYNSVYLVVLWQDMKDLLTKDRFQTFRNLLLSQKLCLFSASDETRKELIKEASHKTFTVKEFKKKKSDLQPASDPKPPSLTAIFKKPETFVKEENIVKLALPELKKMRSDTLTNLKKIADKTYKEIESEIITQEQYLESYTQTKDDIDEAIKYKKEASQKK